MCETILLPTKTKFLRTNKFRFAKITFLKFLFRLARGERKDHIRAESLIINIDYLI